MLQDILARQATADDQQVARFTGQFEVLLRRAVAAVAFVLGVKLIFQNGKIVNSAFNRSLLANADRMLMNELNKMGMNDLIDAFVMQFGDQIGWFKEVVQGTLDGAKFTEMVNFTQEEKRNLSTFQQNTATQVEELVQRNAQELRYTLLRGLGDLPPSALLSSANEAIDRLPAALKELSSTSVSTFYRTVADLGYQKIEAAGTPLHYRYAGPPSGDPVIRPFCKRMMRETEGGETWTRAQIDQMDNGQSKWGMGNVFLNCGGWNCRHQFLIASARMEAAHGGIV